MRRNLPLLTDLQFTIVCLLWFDVLTGEELRQRLKAHHRAGLAAFYLMMGRMEKVDLVRGAYRTRVVKGQTIKERLYQATNLGRRLAREKRTFINSIR